MTGSILLIEDDPGTRTTIERGLKNRGFSVWGASDGPPGLKILETRRVDLILLDLVLPSTEGLELCEAIRASSGVPIIVLTSRGGAGDVVMGLESGADDYIVKPSTLPEIAARVNAVLRRTDALRSQQRQGPLELDPAKMTLALRGEPIELTAIELRLMAEMMRRPTVTFTRSLLLENVWDYPYGGDPRIVDAAVKRLRRKTGRSWNEDVISTVRGVGYRLRIP